MSIVDHTKRAIQGAVLASALLIVPAVAQQAQVAAPAAAPTVPAPMPAATPAPKPAPAPSPLFARESEVSTIADAQAAHRASMSSNGVTISTTALVIVLLVLILVLVI